MNAATDERPASRSYDGPWTSSDGSVFADLVVGDEAICIHGWSSSRRGRGNTRRALGELRSLFPGRAVCAMGIGDDPDQDSWRYWVHLKKTGAVEHIFADDRYDQDIPV